ncbi:MAG: AAA family ATPase [Kiritimatiellae bacterium]|nr:AAA family ATPase [Kiritimatiellia bacterium]
MKITLLEISNFKRLRALRLEPNESGLTVIGGRNGQGKTSVLDAIAFALGGEKYRPSNPKREDAIGEASIHIETDDGLVIERKGKNADLTVTDSTGKRHGQTLINSLISKLAIDLPQFLNVNDKQKADILLQILGIGDKLAKLEREEKAKYDTRTTVGRMAEQKKKAAADMPYYEDVPDEPVSIKELIAQQQEILGRNGVKQQLSDDLEANKRHLATYKAQLKEITEAVKRLEANIAEAESADLTMEDTSELEAQIADFEETNRKISENAAKRRREEEADDLSDQYDALTKEIEDIRKARIALLDGCDLPYPGLTVEDGTLLFDGKAWDCMSGSQQMIVGAAIALRLNPKCKFVRLDKLEQLDLETLGEFNDWLVENGLQAIATRVSTNTDGECSVVIEDGEAQGEKVNIPMPKKNVAKPKAEPKELGDDDYE